MCVCVCVLFGQHMCVCFCSRLSEAQVDKKCFHIYQAVFLDAIASLAPTLTWLVILYPVLPKIIMPASPTFWLDCSKPISTDHGWPRLIKDNRSDLINAEKKHSFSLKQECHFGKISSTALINAHYDGFQRGTSSWSGSWKKSFQFNSIYWNGPGWALALCCLNAWRVLKMYGENSKDKSTFVCYGASKHF